MSHFEGENELCFSTQLIGNKLANLLLNIYLVWFANDPHQDCLKCLVTVLRIFTFLNNSVSITINIFLCFWMFPEYIDTYIWEQVVHTHFYFLFSTYENTVSMNHNPQIHIFMKCCFVC